MCGRFTVKATWADLVAFYRLTMDAPPHNLRPRYNVCPTDPIDTVIAEGGKRDLVTMRWGLVPRWWSKTMSGYYELQNAPGGKQPWYFTARDGSPLLTAAGLWDEWNDRATGERLKSRTMIVTAPSNFAAEIQNARLTTHFRKSEIDICR
jgi:putative SOS response-associated peptidase YedK